MKISIIKYNAGNIQSVQNALRRFDIDAHITGNHDEIRSSDKVIFPGVGEAGSTMNYLKEHKLDILIKELKQPVLGICLGLQLMCRHSEEGNTDCLGIFDVNVKKFNKQIIPRTTKNEQRTKNNKQRITNNEQRTTIKVPQIGWNNLTQLKGKLFNLDQLSTINYQLYVYFVHSYYAELSDYTSAVADYGISYSAALEKENFFATQFHPEKSGKVGEKILQNFLNIST